MTAWTRGLQNAVVSTMNSAEDFSQEKYVLLSCCRESHVSVEAQTPKGNLLRVDHFVAGEESHSIMQVLKAFVRKHLAEEGMLDI